MSTQKKRILFVISSLNLGGAERQMLLLCQMLKTQADVRIVSLEFEGPLKEKYKQAFPEIFFVQKTNPLIQIIEIKRIVRISKPDVVITWLYKADLIGGIASKLAGNFPVIWSARNSALPHFSTFKRLTLLLFSRLIPKWIIANGKPAYNFHKSIGYPTKKMQIIPNTLAPWTSRTRSQSRLLQMDATVDKIRIGIASRQASGKGILESISAFDDHLDRLPLIDLRLIGQETDESKKWLSKGEYKKHSVHALTTDTELAKWFQDLDLYLMSSTAWESQPNSLLEAIAIGCPVLVSDFVDLDFDLPDFNVYNAASATNLVSAIQKYGDIETSRIIVTVEELRSKVGSIYNHDSILDKWLKIIEI
jgi:glycosyltransferase involved in cell wall biosynthesis